MMFWFEPKPNEFKTKRNPKFVSNLSLI